MALVVEAFDGRLLDRAVHSLDLTVGPRVVGFGEAVLDVVCLADHVEAHLARSGGVAVAGLLGALDVIVGQYCVDAVRHGSQQVFQELPRGPSISWVTANLLGAVDSDEHVQLALGSLHFSDIHVEEPDGVALKALSSGLIALDIRQAGDAVPLRQRCSADRLDAGSTIATHRGSHPAAAACAAAKRRPSLPRLRSGSSNKGPSARSSDPRPSLACTTSPLSWG